MVEGESVRYGWLEKWRRMRSKPTEIAAAAASIPMMRVM